MFLINIVTLFILCESALGVRINFTSCQSPEWTCDSNQPTDIVYSCSAVPSDDFIIHLEDFYTNQITGVTVQNCRDVRFVLDCPTLQRTSQLQRFKVKDCDRVEFISLSSASLVQTPPEVSLENVREIVSLPRNIFKSPSSDAELKCIGTNYLKKIRIVNSKINSINTKAFYNVTGIKSIEFENVTITNVQSHGLAAIMGHDDTSFSIRNCKIENLNFKAFTVKSRNVIIQNTVFGDITSNALNITSEYLQFTGNSVKVVYGNSLALKSINTEITNNEINLLKTNALIGLKCLRKRAVRKRFNFSSNRILTVEPYSLSFDYASCKSSGTAVNFNQNKIDCKCRNISYLTSSTPSTEMNNVILDISNNNTCISAPCTLPIEVVKLLLDSDMCQLNLDPRVVCLFYSDRKANNNEVTTDEDVTEPAPTFYLIRQANSQTGDVSAAMTAINKDDLLKNSHLNMTNRTTLKVYFDSSMDFVESLRSVGTNRKPEVPKTPPRDEFVNRCIENQCRNRIAHDKQKALDFYKYLYAQLRPPKENEVKNNQT